MITLNAALAASIKIFDGPLTPLVDMVLARYGVGHDGRCACESCSHRRGLTLRDDLRTHYRSVRTYEQIAAEKAIFTDEQRSLAWSPMPPCEYTGAHDGRTAGGPGFGETPRSRWVIARHRMRRRYRDTHCLRCDQSNANCTCGGAV